MARPREPIDLIKAKGKKHLSEREYEERKSSELDVPFVDVAPPECLTTKKQREEFEHYATMLLSLGIFTELDVDALARYIISKELYLAYTKRLKAALNDCNYDLRDISAIQTMQDKAFKQCVASANELCLNITSRARLVIPKALDDDDDEL